MPTDRRTFIKRLALATLAAPLGLELAHAQMGGGQMQHEHGPMAGPAGPSGVGPDVLAPVEIPWEEGTCAFCGMTLATPAGATVPPGFRERTYGQIRLAPGAVEGADAPEAFHYESLGCLFNHAYALGLTDGHGTTFYVADLSAPPATEADLLLGRSAAYLWAENLSVSMKARLGAFPDRAAVATYHAEHPELGRVHVHGEDELMDLAPLPIGNLVPLLVKHLGL